MKLQAFNFNLFLDVCVEKKQNLFEFINKNVIRSYGNKGTPRLHTNTASKLQYSYSGLSVYTTTWRVSIRTVGLLTTYISY